MIETILNKLEECRYKVCTDTRENPAGTVFFALKGDSFDGNAFAQQAIAKGAVAAVVDDAKQIGENIYLVDDVLKTLQMVAQKYREKFTIPIIVIGGSNGKTTSKELTRDVLRTKYKTHSTKGSFNNHIGVPLSILSMPLETEMGIFEIGANHPEEHTELLEILQPNHVVVTNNGMDHLEGFGTPEGSRKANKELYDWALKNSATVFANKQMPDLMQDSEHNTRILYPEQNLVVTKPTPLTIRLGATEYATHLAGDYNVDNIQLAVAIGEKFGVDVASGLKTICDYIPLSKRSQFLTKNEVDFIVDCYNANPSSMKLSLDSFLASATDKRGVVLGDMLELGTYTEIEHRKIVEYVRDQKLECVVFVGAHFKKALENETFQYVWFSDSESANKWFWEQDFAEYTFLLKGSRGMKIEKIYEISK